ncbi:hypothetical protein GSI_15349 [Ganoderma sinense ZZ0214-1]|uniref:Telomere-associated protein Rif1 N-terminal domain-containing protein n=1 Tax=Ganoderma sinense ZZ0214-1 TaxID=1077348 RepID=A0A2G8RMB3_9APHY|nr:hypothetical protein GSI_15349 [Ganoderma sinense ZZ0214-1]
MVRPTIHPHEDLVCAARDSSTLCQQAIQIVSLIFRFPALYSLFTDTVLSQLLDDLITVSRSPDIPSFDGDKTCALAAWTFAAIQLPATILSPHQGAIVAWMSELAVHMSPKNKHAKVMHHLWSEYPAACLPDIVGTLPKIFSHLVSSDAAIRAEGATALSGFACALLSVWSSVRSSFKAAVLHELRKFLFSEGGKEDPPGAKLPQIITRAVREDTAGAPHNGPRWAVTVICCLIVLSGHGILASHRLCSFVLKSAEVVMNCKKKPGSELLVCIWRSLIWAFAHFPENDIPAPATLEEQPERHSSHKTAFDIVKQEPRGGNAICLIACLLYGRPGRSGGPSRVEFDKAVIVLKDVVSSPFDSNYRNGVSILERLVRAIGAAKGTPGDVSITSWTPDDIPIKSLFSRRMLDAELSAFSSSIQHAGRVSPSVIRPLLEHEIQQHWKELLEIWTICARRELRGAELIALPDTLVHVWQALLLVKTHLTQGLEHLTTSPDSTHCVVLAIAEFLDWSPFTDGKGSSLPQDVIQRRALSICHQLWDVACKVFSDSWLLTAAGLLLSNVVRHTFDLSTEEVKTAWSDLCASLIATNAPDFIARLALEDEDHRNMAIRQKLWSLTAETWTAREPAPSWTDSVDLLVVPLRNWTLDKETDMTVWSAVLQHAISQAHLLAEPSLVVFEAIAERGFKDEAELLDAPKLLLHMLSLFTVDDDACRKSVFLQHVGTVLRGLYAKALENMPLAIQALAHIRRVVQDCPVNAILPVLSSLADGLSAWIGDENEVLLVEDHNAIVVPLYCDALNALRKIPVTSDTLQTFATFFCSAFVRIPEPATGPLAFCEFWTDIRPSLTHLNGAYPEEIKAALRASHDVLGIDVPSCLSLETDLDGHSSILTSPAKPSPAKRSMQRHPRAEHEEDSLGRPWQSTLSPFREKASPAASAKTSPFPNTPGAKRSLSHTLPEADSPVTPARRRNNDANRSYMPSSPTEALRARRLAAGPSSRVAHERARTASDRPIKRRKLSPLHESPTAHLRGGAAGPSKRVPSPATSSATSRSGWRFDGVEVETFKDFKRRTTTPQPSETTAANMLSPEVPSPTVAVGPSSDDYDDYDAWEVPICVDDMDMVPDSQPSDGKDDDDDDSLLPSFMKEHKAVGGDRRDDIPTPSSKASGKRPQHTARRQTAPPSFRRDDSPDAEDPRAAAAPVKRANTISALEGLRDVFDNLQRDGSQLEMEQIVAASAITHRITGLLVDFIIVIFIASPFMSEEAVVLKLIKARQSDSVVLWIMSMSWYRNDG